MRAVLHLLYARQNKEVSVLKRSGMLVALLVGIMLFMIPLRIWIDFHEFAGGYDEKI